VARTCAGVERIAVAASLHDAFVERLVSRTAALRVGHGADPPVELGPLVSEAHRARFEELVADAVARGGEVVAGGTRPQTALPGWFHEPTVIVGEPLDARIRSEELFGPAVVVVEKDNEGEMVRWANDSPFGLGASVWSRDLDRAGAISARLDAGMVWVNDHAYSFGAGQAPWTGGTSGSRPTEVEAYGLYALSHVKLRRPDRGRLTGGGFRTASARSTGCAGS
jgi:phenylacetaldehyde dehydrogenase